MSLQAFSRILRPLRAPTSRQFLRGVSRYTQVKRETSKEEWGTLVLGLGLLSTAIVWSAKEDAWSINMTPAEQAKSEEQGG